MESHNHVLVGAWELVSVEFRVEDGSVCYPMGNNPKGLLMYSSDGSMSVQIMGEGRTRFAVPDVLAGTPDELKSAFSTYTAYFGRFEYRPDEHRVTHYVDGSLFPNWTGVDQLRNVMLLGDILELSAPKILVLGQSGIPVLVWRRKA